MKIYYIKILKSRYSLIFGRCSFVFYKYKFKDTHLTFFFDWVLGLGFIAIRKWQTKKWEELKKMSDKEWANTLDKIMEHLGAKDEDHS